LFSIFAQWLYAGKLYHCEADNHWADICITNLLRLYAFAYEQKVSLLRDDVTNEVISKSIVNNEDITRNMVELALIIIPPHALLFKWMAYTRGQKANASEIAWIAQETKAESSAVIKFMQLAWSERAASLGDQHNLSDSCAFHEHYKPPKVEA
jgi:hypothetical protein